ncbi:unnamed protein product [Brassicogethes aeneus]|uniref:Transmembrane protein n=1 Tax=Brassicogethes aeneus TaxID=1431903 RepID=A0A9P0B5Z5_BRAAE|nr:unnamed protein product [Brassicogethes aeneus]
MGGRTILVGEFMVVIIFVLNLSCLYAYRTDDAKLHLKLKDKNTIVKTIRIGDKVLIEEYKITEGPDTRFLLYETEEDGDVDNDNEYDDTQSPLESWSVVWYIASFGGLVAFFLVVSCSEWCCRRNASRNCRSSSDSTRQVAPDVPPPSYEQFAPPPYESLTLKGGEKSEFDVYVVPVEAMSSLMRNNGGNIEDAPPSYYMASERYLVRDKGNGDVAVASSSKESSVVVDVSLLESTGT